MTENKQLQYTSVQFDFDNLINYYKKYFAFKILTNLKSYFYEIHKNASYSQPKNWKALKRVYLVNAKCVSTKWVTHIKY